MRGKQSGMNASGIHEPTCAEHEELSSEYGETDENVEANEQYTYDSPMETQTDYEHELEGELPP